MGIRRFDGLLAFIFLVLTRRAKELTVEASGLHYKHTLFGKCTVDDVDFISVGQPYGFLSPSGLGKVVVSVEDCKTLMGRSLEETLGLLLGDRKAEDTNKNKMDAIVPELASSPDPVQQVDALISAHDAAYREELVSSTQTIASFLLKAVEDTTVFVLGLGPEVVALNMAARSVVAIDGSREHCGNFLKSQEGACSVQNGVHLYCIRPHEAESPPTDESPPTGDDSQGGKFPEQNREKSISLSSLSQGFGGSSEGRWNVVVESSGREISNTEASSEGGRENFLEYEKLVVDLIQHQFGSIPISALVVLPPFAVAKLLFVLPFVDQSTTIVVRSRLPKDALEVLSKFFRVRRMNEVRSQTGDPLTGIERVIWLDRRFGPKPEDGFWMKFLSKEWALTDEGRHTKCMDDIEAHVLSSVAAGDLSTDEALQISIYKKILSEASLSGSEVERREILDFCEEMRLSTVNGVSAGVSLQKIREFAEGLVLAKLGFYGMKPYLDLLQEASANQAARGVANALVYKTVQVGIVAHSFPEILDAFEDCIEEACELAFQKPHLFCICLQLILASSHSAEALRRTQKRIALLRNSFEGTIPSLCN